MNPALSVIFFTTLSGAGFGLLAWLGLAVAWLQLRGAAVPSLQGLQLALLVLGGLLAVIGLVSSLAHLGRPGRAWRALSQWRTSWLSREGVVAVATLLAAAMLGGLWLAGAGAAWNTAIAMLALAMALLALGAVACTAMIYASLTPIPAWRHGLVLPNYLLFSLLSGLVALLLGVSVLRPEARPATAAGMLAGVALLALLLLASKWRYWWQIDRGTLPATRGAAVGLPGRHVEVFERPHTQASYITREMGFELARRHARALRIAASGLLAGLPVLAWALASVGLGGDTALLALAAAGVLGGAFVERWLFFAQARHMVTLYY